MLKNLKKYIPKRKYRERSQLERRNKLGFLEKKQDYKIRAEDYHKKEQKFKKLKEEARLKNPEEFYFKMANSKIVEGEHFNVREGKSLEERLTNHNKLLNLVNFKKSMQEKEKEKLIVDMQLMDHGNNKDSTHKIFFDTPEEVAKFDAAEYFETDAKLLGNKTNRMKLSQLEKVKLPDNEEEIKNLNIEKKKKYKKIAEKIQNIDNLNKISNTLAYQKHLIKPAKKKKIEGEGNVYKFFNERKR